MVGFLNKEIINMDMDIKQLVTAIKSIAEEKNLPEDSVKDVVEQALAAAYRRDYGDRDQEVRIQLNLNNGDVEVFVTKEVVENVEEDKKAYQISLSDALKIKKDVKVGDQVEIKDHINKFGRVAAQTAKQVILQKLREAEREIIFSEYEDKIGTVVNANVSRVEGNILRVDLGRAQAIMPRSEQIQGEHYYPGQRVKVYLKEIEKGPRGPQIIASRGSTEFIEKLFRNEVPEMESNAVEIKAIAREGGVRSKIAVKSNVQGVDAVGTFVGGHGIRVNAVMSEVGEQEKIDIIVFSEDPKEYISNALSPTKINKVIIDEAAKKAEVLVDEDQLSVAIGRAGQNVRLASKLTGYEIDVKLDKKEEAKVNEEKIKPPKLKKKSELESSLLEAIEEHGQDSN